jgi:hypothetical protein
MPVGGVQQKEKLWWRWWWWVVLSLLLLVVVVFVVDVVVVVVVVVVVIPALKCHMAFARACYMFAIVHGCILKCRSIGRSSRSSPTTALT